MAYMDFRRSGMNGYVKDYTTRYLHFAQKKEKKLCIHTNVF